MLLITAVIIIVQIQKYITTLSNKMLKRVTNVSNALC